MCSHFLIAMHLCAFRSIRTLVAIDTSIYLHARHASCSVALRLLECHLIFDCTTKIDNNKTFKIVPKFQYITYISVTFILHYLLIRQFPCCS